jgi:hypothetical protein
MAGFLLESNRKFCAIFRRQIGMIGGIDPETAAKGIEGLISTDKWIALICR